MIKVNLALRKGAAAVDVRGKHAGALKMPKLDASILNEPQLRKAILCVIVAFVASYMLDGFESDQLAKVDQRIAKGNAELSKKRAELLKTAGYEPLKKQLDEDGELIRTKLVTIQKLILDRQVPPKLLLSISSQIPTDVWLSEFSMDEKGVTMRGSSLGIVPITEFMKTLGDSEFITDLRLVNSEKQRDPVAGEVATFELAGKRK